MRVKICGITNADDAWAAAQAGADAIGLVFYPPSPRHVTVVQAAAILTALPPFVTRVGLFVNPEPDWVNQVLKACALDLLQFHGEESPALCRAFAKPYLKVLRVAGETDLRPWVTEYAEAQGLLLDKADQRVYGGSGTSFSWWPLPPGLNKPVVLAGGLHGQNVARAIQTVRPYAVDVSSGVEISPGRKDHGKMREFVALARQAAGET